MENENKPQLGVTFYATSQENYFKIREIENRLKDASIFCCWTSKDYHGEKVSALDVYENANIVAGYL